jgi:hypothetical protein
MTKVPAAKIPDGFKKVDTGTAIAIDENRSMFVGQYTGKSIAGGKGKSNLHIFKDEQGNTVNVWGSYTIDEFVKTLKKNQWALMEYKETVKLKGKKTVKKYDFYVK